MPPRPERPWQRVRGSVLLLALLTLLHGAAVVQAAPPPGRLSMSVQHGDVAELFETLSRQGQVNVLVGAGVSGEVSVSLYDVTVDEAVRAVAAAAGFAVEHKDGNYYIVNRDDAGRERADSLTEVRAFKVQYTDPAGMQEILVNHLSRYGKVTAVPERKLLVVEDKPDFLARVERILAEVDRQPVQILIEAQILEVTLDRTQTYGLDWSRLFTHDKGGGAFGVQGLAAPGTPGLFMTLVSANVEAALNALDEDGKVRTLSTPKLLALEHQEAEVVIGDRIGYRVTTTINQVTTESVDFIESGVILKVTPFVDRTGRIMMEIHPEVSTGSVSDGIPSVSTTEVTTQLLAADGQPIFIGGLMRTTKSDRKQGVPVLRDVPLVGKLFSNDEALTLNTETVVLITPRIVQPGSEFPESRRIEAHPDLAPAPLTQAPPVTAPCVGGDCAAGIAAGPALAADANLRLVD
ncbi:MAG: type II secretion system protein GspD [Gammaproteobacteria bacterium]|nr:type II secretion system protein GspD [Gammaproteobacteria bacterium]MCP5202511.1 type II secretion system protein GspD [Gammaproteobacteria bacterium]